VDALVLDLRAADRVRADLRPRTASAWISGERTASVLISGEQTASVLICGAPTPSRARVAAVAVPPSATNSARVAKTFA
jgi:hypothetical protein